MVSQVDIMVAYDKRRQNKRMLIFVPVIKYPANRQTVKDPDVPMDKLNRFRIMSMLTITILWIVLGITFGILWDS